MTIPPSCRLHAPVDHSIQHRRHLSPAVLLSYHGLATPKSDHQTQYPPPTALKRSCHHLTPLDHQFQYPLFASIPPSCRLLTPKPLDQPLQRPHPRIPAILPFYRPLATSRNSTPPSPPSMTLGRFYHPHDQSLIRHRPSTALSRSCRPPAPLDRRISSQHPTARITRSNAEASEKTEVQAKINSSKTRSEWSASKGGLRFAREFGELYKWYNLVIALHRIITVSTTVFLSGS